jgi:hypothetical protein
MFAECIQDCGERQLATVSSAQPPTNDLPGLEIEHDRQVVLLTHEAQMREVLYPSTRVNHPGVAEASLRPLLVTKHCKAFQSIRCSSYLCGYTAATSLFLARASNGDTSKSPNTTGFLLVPAKMDSKTLNTVEWMLGMGGTKCRYILCVPGLLGGGRPVVMRAT